MSNTVMQHHWIKAAGALVALTFIAMNTSAQERPVYRQAMPLLPGQGGDVALPYPFTDAAGNFWRICNNGWFLEQGNAPVFNQGAALYINGNVPGQQDNQAHLDARTGELVVGNMHINGISLTRRILFHRRDNLIRYIDVVHNDQNEQQTVTLSVTSNLNFGITASQFVPDPARKDHNLAWVAQTSGGSVVELHGGSNAKVNAVLDCPQGNNIMTATYVLNVPGGRDVAILHLHKSAPTLDAGVHFVDDLKDAALLKTIPAALRKLIVNFHDSGEWIGDVELPRGDLLDTVELRNGDLFRGTLKETAFALKTSFGTVNLPSENVMGLLNTGEFRARQLIVMSDGQIFGGHVQKETLDLQLASGQVTRIPLAQVNRVGYRKRADEPEEWTFNKPLVLLRTGERIFIKPLTANLDVATRYGTLSIKPTAIAAISFQNEDTSIHEVTLTDGSRFSGLLGAEQFDVVLETGGQRVKFPASAVVKLQFVPRSPDVADLDPTVHMFNEDILVGTLTGKLSIETAFDTLSVDASEIRLLTRTKDKDREAQAILWNGTVLSGQVLEPDVTCELKSGMTMKLPVTLLQEYSQPPREPATTRASTRNAIGQ